MFDGRRGEQAAHLPAQILARLQAQEVTQHRGAARADGAEVVRFVDDDEVREEQVLHVLMPERPRVRMSLRGTMRESFECEITRMVASGTPCAASGAMASRCQVLTTELGESTVMRNGSSVAERFASRELVAPLVRVVNGDRGGDVGLPEADAVAEHRAAVLLELATRRCAACRW